MIFYRLWRAERRASKEYDRIHAKYGSIIDEAQRQKNDQDYHLALSAMLFELDLNDEPEVIRTDMLIVQARKLGIPLPLKPTIEIAERNEDPNWHFNRPN